MDRERSGIQDGMVDAPKRLEPGTVPTKGKLDLTSMLYQAGCVVDQVLDHVRIRLRCTLFRIGASGTSRLHCPIMRSRL